MHKGGPVKQESLKQILFILKMRCLLRIMSTPGDFYPNQGVGVARRRYRIFLGIF
jgi:hypothetical protein